MRLALALIAVLLAACTGGCTALGHVACEINAAAHHDSSCS